MFDVYLKFQTFEHCAQFLAMVLVNTFMVYISCKKSRFSLTPFIVINVLFFIAWGLFIGLDRDETEHLHCAWMVSQGLVPYKDFWQHHLPLVWVLLAPVCKLLQPTVLIFTMSRIFSAFIFTAIAYTGWQIAQHVWQGQAQRPVYWLLVFSASILGEFLWIRPDLCMTLFLLTGLHFALEIPNEKIRPVFFSGVSFALAASFMPKEYLLFVLPIVLLARTNNLRVRKFFVYCLGLFAGSVPLLLYLIQHGIVKDSIFWVFAFNQKKITLSNIALSATFPAVMAFIGVLGAYLLVNRNRKFKNMGGLTIVCAFCLSTATAFTGTVGRYYLEFWLILCAILGCGWDIQGALERVSSVATKSVLGGFCLSLLIFPNFFHGKTHISTYLQGDTKTISRLMEYCKADTCFLTLPLHPIFSYDATGFYSARQFDFVDTFPRITHYAKGASIAQSMLNVRPAVVMYKFHTKEIVSYLLGKGLISREDSGKLKALLSGHYSVRKLGDTEFYVRNDRLE